MRAKKEINVQIGERVKMARERNGLTQEQFAELINKTPQFVSDLERGVSGISLDTLRLICVELGITSDSLLFADTDVYMADILIAKIKRMDDKEICILNEVADGVVRAMQTFR